MSRSAETWRRTGAHPSGDPVAYFDVHFSRTVDADGRLVAPLPEFAKDAQTLDALYRGCVLTRAFDRRAVSLQRTGRLGTYPSSLGQEGAAVAIGAAMRPEDVLLTTYRETGALLMRGVTMTELLRYWGGDERGMAFERATQDFPISVPIASHATQAVGVAYAMWLREEPRAVVCVLGDGASSKGDFYEAINGAGVWQLPVVFVIINNQWAISVPRAKQSRAGTLAQKAIAAGFDGEQVDGNDAIGLRHAVQDALDAARRGGGPHLIEALTYRLSDHTTADDARRYRNTEEVEKYAALDANERLRKFLVGRGLWDDDRQAALEANCRTEIDHAVEAYLATPPREPASMFDHLFETLPPALRAERAELADKVTHDG